MRQRPSRTSERNGVVEDSKAPPIAASYASQPCVSPSWSKFQVMACKEEDNNSASNTTAFRMRTPSCRMWRLVNPDGGGLV
jgi:hypothetical protein